MNKETAIMELIITSQQHEAVDAAIRALGDWTELEILKNPLKAMEEKLAKKMEKLSEIVNGGKIDMDKA